MAEMLLRRPHAPSMLKNELMQRLPGSGRDVRLTPSVAPLGRPCLLRPSNCAAVVANGPMTALAWQQQRGAVKPIASSLSVSKGGGGGGRGGGGQRIRALGGCVQTHARGWYPVGSIAGRRCFFATVDAVSSNNLGTLNVDKEENRATSLTTNGAGGAAEEEEESEESAFLRAAQEGNIVPISRRIFSDHLTPVLAYRCLVKEDEREAPSFLFESVENTDDGGGRSGRYSYVGAQPSVEIVATAEKVSVVDHVRRQRQRMQRKDPLHVAEEISASWRPVHRPELPACFCGGWVGYTSYDTVRYVESKKLPFSKAPEDDRGLPDIHLSLYNDVVVFDHITKVVHVVCWVHVDSYSSVRDAYQDGMARLDDLVARLQPSKAPLLAAGTISLDTKLHSQRPRESNMTKDAFKAMVVAAKEYILSGDIFQIVLSQRFERRTFADPFEVYRALRVVNPSPYLAYLQARGSILVASSPEILCRIAGKRVVNRPLAGTRPRGRTHEEDEELERDLLADEKEVAEHVMLVDLGRNDVGKVSVAGSVNVEKLMVVERYSHVMHISSTVTGELLPELSAWDALRAALPVGTVSGAPKVRAMELIDELEPTRRGPYSGGIGYVSFASNLDFALALRTMVFPTSSTGARSDTLFARRRSGGSSSEPQQKQQQRQEWVVHLQAGAGIVADSNPEAEYQETVNKSAALGRAIDLAEASFLGPELGGVEQ